MEPITSWSRERVSEWLKGLDAPLQQYPFSEWQVSGLELLQLSSQELDKLGVTKIGHQELILEAVEKLCSLTYGIGGESLRGLTEKLRAVAHSLQMGIQGRWRVNTYDGQSATKLPANILQAVVDLIVSSKGLFSLLNRHQLSLLSGYTASKSIITHCQDLGTTVHKDTTVYEKEKDIISICRQLVAVCDEILGCSHEALLSHTAQLESVDLVPVSPGDHLGIEITSTGCSNHYVTGTAAESPVEFCEQILAGDEVIQVNGQIVVGWSRENLLRKLQENPKGVTLVLKRVPGSVKRQQKEQPEEEEKQREDEGEEEEDQQRYSFFERVSASVRSAIHGPVVLQQHMGQEESELSSNRGLEGSLTLTSEQDHKGGLAAIPRQFEGADGARLSPGHRGDGSVSPRSASPREQDLGRASISSCPEMGGPTETKEPKKNSTKGLTTALSRRRVSCRELGRPDCDGWLWRKRRESSVFLTHKWQRFWFVLKGPSLYWYKSQQEEKAEGLVQVASYSIESAGEHKRKYVFKMCHQRFQNFIFAAENVSDMSKWINCLITAIQKYKKLHKNPPDSEEECYSETESEDESSPAQRRRNKVNTKTQFNTLPRTKGKKGKALTATPPPEGTKGTAAVPVDEMGVLFNRLKEGGVSLIGQDQPLTHDHFRRSFIRRNKNPVINEKAHTLRALQSTLKAKEAELQLINKVLEDSELTAEKFRRWKELNEDLSQEVERLAALRAKDGGAAEQPEAAPGMAAGAPAEGACGLSLSDGEELVDAEPADVLLEIPSDAAALEPFPVLELSLGSLQDSIDETLVSGRAANAAPSSATENYFYI
ncbi:connector enhancer of kinase suppressor of ras 1 isoform 2-T2 [Aplochiton taeniatus]